MQPVVQPVVGCTMTADNRLCRVNGVLMGSGQRYDTTRYDSPNTNRT